MKKLGDFMVKKRNISFDFDELVECFSDYFKYWSLSEQGAIVSDYGGEILIQGKVTDKTTKTEGAPRKKYGITDQGIGYIEKKLKEDPVFRQEFLDAKAKLEETLPKLLKMSKEELFNAVYDTLKE